MGTLVGIDSKRWVIGPIRLLSENMPSYCQPDVHGIENQMQQGFFSLVCVARFLIKHA